ncbi:hypothetical protein [Lyngbya confervoides]|uniref:Uncharacterized protein n=1 Tax=Lyngbya confervoides BDU141951 TaxID=1574623 RepID=A0ABD4T0M6_9CYAN|nr:hypothetical protein [Lyngbya confervoides]MCM1982058.1 hypothetical protein [Lyngbya confervoides BDU141951]
MAAGFLRSVQVGNGDAPADIQIGRVSFQRVSHPQLGNPEPGNQVWPLLEMEQAIVREAAP